ncbi:MAG: hypothetical protein E6I55_06500 [Chloroflexi bacterium]|nr:MAG: hypothetical protein E6I55_06500 [Chloroflexota bacterium]
MPPQQRLRRAPLCATLVLLATAMTSCSPGGAPSSSATPSRLSPGAARFTASSFTTIIPDRWSDKTKDRSAIASVNAEGTVVMLLYAPATAAHIPNEHIDVSMVAQPVPDDALEMFLESAAQNGATNLSRAQPFDLNGSTGIFITYDLKPSTGVALHEQDMLVNHGGTTYEIVLNTAQPDFAVQAPALQRVLSMWRWTG